MIFKGTIHVPDDAVRLPATMDVAGGHLQVESEGQLIGNWRLDKIELTHRQDGILLWVDDESLVLNPSDRYGFTDAIEAGKAELPKRRGLLRRRKKAPHTQRPDTSRPEAAAREPRPPTPPAPPPPPSQPVTSDRDHFGGEPQAPAGPSRDRSMTAHSDRALAPASDSEVASSADERSRSEPPPAPAATKNPPARPLPPVEPPEPTSWPFVDDPLQLGGLTDAWSGPTRQEASGVTETDAPVEAGGLPTEARIPETGLTDIEILPNPTPDPEVDHEVVAPPVDPPAAGALTEAVRSARAEPLLPNFRKSEREETPVDINAEIFGTDEPKRTGLVARLGDKWLDIPLVWRRGALVGAVLILLTLLIPRVVASALVLAGLAACLVGGAGMADPSYTRRLPPELNEVRLLIAGGSMLVIGFLIGLPSL